jgi:hypothetical protein
LGVSSWDGGGAALGAGDTSGAMFVAGLLIGVGGVLRGFLAGETSPFTTAF